MFTVILTTPAEAKARVICTTPSIDTMVISCIKSLGFHSVAPLIEACVSSISDEAIAGSYAITDGELIVQYTP